MTAWVLAIPALAWSNAACVESTVTCAPNWRAASCLARSSDNCAIVACALKLARSACSGPSNNCRSGVPDFTLAPAWNRISVMRPLTSEVTLTWWTAARSPTAVSRFGITSDLASAMVTATGGGLLPAKNCLIILDRKASKPTSAPTSSTSASPTMMNQRSIRTGRLRGSMIGLPEILASLAIFMSCTFCSYRWCRNRRQREVQMRSNCGFVKSDAADNELAKLPFEGGGFAVVQTGNGGKPRQRRHQYRVVGKPEQVERLAADARCVAGRDRAVEGSSEHRPDQASDLGVEQAGEFAVVEMARGHEAQPLRFLVVGTGGNLHEMTDHAPDQFDQRFGRRLLAEQMGKIRISLAFLGKYFGVQRGLGGEVLEQQPFRNGGRGRDALGRGAGKAVAGKATLGGAKDQLAPQIAGHAEVRHGRVSNHSPWQSQGNCATHHGICNPRSA